MEPIAPIRAAETDAAAAVDFVKALLRIDGLLRKHRVRKLEPFENCFGIDLAIGVECQTQRSGKSQGLQAVQVVTDADLI